MAKQFSKSELKNSGTVRKTNRVDGILEFYYSDRDPIRVEVHKKVGNIKSIVKTLIKKGKILPGFTDWKQIANLSR